jgi:hypothetical protein
MLERLAGILGRLAAIAAILGIVAKTLSAASDAMSEAGRLWRVANADGQTNSSAAAKGSAGRTPDGAMPAAGAENPSGQDADSATPGAGDAGRVPGATGNGKAGTSPAQEAQAQPVENLRFLTDGTKGIAS